MIRRTVLAVAVVAAVAGALPASATDDAYIKTGVNLGETGSISLAFGVDLGSSNADTPDEDRVAHTHCHFRQQNTVGNSAVLVLEGHAHATPHSTPDGKANQPISVVLRCRLLDFDTGDEVMDYKEGTAGGNAVWLDPQYADQHVDLDVQSSSYIVCSAVRVDWSNGDVTSNGNLDLNASTGDEGACEVPLI